MDKTKFEELFNQCENDISFMLSCKKIEELIKYSIPTIYIHSLEEICEFVCGCMKLRNNLINIYNKGITFIIAPGDSPIKIVKWLKMTSPDIPIKFISFPLSNLSCFENNIEINEYIKKNIEECNIGNCMILDYVSKGITVNKILTILVEKLKSDEKLNIVSEYENEINHVLKKHNYCQEKYIIDISNYFDIKYMSQLIRSELYNNRGIKKLIKFEENEPIFIDYDMIGFKIFVLFARCYYFQSDEFDVMINKI
jgi:hypothetical protein